MKSMIFKVHFKSFFAFTKSAHTPCISANHMVLSVQTYMVNSFSASKNHRVFLFFQTYTVCINKWYFLKLTSANKCYKEKAQILSFISSNIWIKSCFSDTLFIKKNPLFVYADEPSLIMWKFGLVKKGLTLLSWCSVCSIMNLSLFSVEPSQGHRCKMPQYHAVYHWYHRIERIWVTVCHGCLRETIMCCVITFQ